MTIFAGDIKLVASKVMDDVPEGGGGPTAVMVVDGASNNIFEDISEFDRAGGKVSLRKLHVSVQTDNTDTYLGSNIIVAEPPNDPNVSITLFSTKDTFDTRDLAQNRVESYLTRGPAWNGMLFERHVAGQRSIQLFQRPGTSTPPIGRTLALVLHEDESNETLQYVRITRVESEIRLFYDADSGEDYPAMIATCDLSDSLRYDFMGSTANRAFTAQTNTTKVRDTTVADAATYTGVVALKTPASIGDLSIGASSIYTQLVPSSRTETIALDQKPAAQRTFKLASSPRLIEVGLTPHSMRVRVGQENRSFSWVQMLRPLPAAETVVVSYRALGTWYTLIDDGTGLLTGSGVGTVNYQTGSIAVTLPALPDVGSSIIYSWGEATAYTSRAGQAGFRAPEFAYALPHQALKPGSVTVGWMSGGVAQTLTDDGAGLLTGDGTGQVNYASGRVFVRPANMIDAGGEFNTAYTYSTLITQNVEMPTLDAGGFGQIALDEVPFPRSVSVKWITVRSVTESSGSSEIATVKTTGVENVEVQVPAGEAVGLTPSSTSVIGGATVTMTFNVLGVPDGTYTYSIEGNVTDQDFLSGSRVGTFPVAGGKGSFGIVIAPAASYAQFSVSAYKPNLARAAGSGTIAIAPFPARLTDIPANMPQPAIRIRTPVNANAQPIGGGNTATVIAGMYLGGKRESGAGIYVAVFAIHSEQYGWYYDPPAEQSLVWSQAEIDAQQKTMTSLNGTVTSYKVWAGSAYSPSQNVSYSTGG